MLKATPQRLGPGLVAAAAPYKTAQLCHPGHGLRKRGRLVRRCWTMMDGTIEGLPFFDLQQHATRELGYRPGSHRGIQHPPGDDAVEGQTALQPLRRGQLSGFNATATFQNPVPDFNTPATRVPANTLAGLFRSLDRDRGQQQPLNGLAVQARIDFTDLHGPQGHARQAFRLTMAGRTQRDRTKTPGQRGLTARLRTPAGHLQEEVLQDRLCLHRGPYMMLRPLDTAVP